MRRVVLGLSGAALCLLAVGSANAQMPPLPPGTRTISVSGHGDAKAKPDEMIVSFTLDSNARTGAECTRLQSAKTSKVVDALKKKLNRKGEVQTSNFSLMPVTESIPINAPASAPTPGGPWSFMVEIQATTDKLENVGSLIQAALAAGAVRTSQTGVQEVPVNTPAENLRANGLLAGNARFYGPPGQVETRQMLFVNFQVQADGASPEDAVKQGTQITQRIEKALKDKLGKNGGLQITQFTVNWANPNVMPPPLRVQYRTRQTYTARINVIAKTSQLDLLEPLLEAGMAAGAAQLDSVSFTLGADAAARTEAIAAASKDAQTKAESVAGSMGVKLGKVLGISINANAQPQMIPGAGFAMSFARASEAPHRLNMPVLPREVGFTADVSAVYEIR